MSRTTVSTTHSSETGNPSSSSGVRGTELVVVVSTVVVVVVGTVVVARTIVVVVVSSAVGESADPEPHPASRSAPAAMHKAIRD
jgi:hypothetical protein